jgi:glyoxalase family protein
MQHANGLHHITAISGPAQENLDFYVGVLGMRLVKKSVNQDDPGTYHLFYADAEGRPGTDLTFFPWPQLARPRMGHGLTHEVALEVPGGSIDYWGTRLHQYGARIERRERRFGDDTLALVDPHGLRLRLVARDAARPFTPWEASPVPAVHQVRGLFGAQIWEREASTTASFLTGVLGFQEVGTDDGWTRYGFANAPGVVDVKETPGVNRGAWGVGAVHHLAWRVDDEQHQLALRSQVAAAGARPTSVIDRFWFKSVYFQEPGGVLFELATDGPGFAVDEPADKLGETLVLPPWLESSRTAIEEALPVLSNDIGRSLEESATRGSLPPRGI